MTYGDSRKDILALVAILEQHKRELHATIAQLNTGIAKLLSQADDLLTLAVEEASPSVKAKRVTYNKPLDSESALIYSTILSDPRKPERPSRSKGKPRRCSVCGQPGHRAPTCTVGRPKR